MSSRGHHLTAALLAELELHGLRGTVERGGKHPALVFTHDGHQHSLTFPGTPSDRRSRANSLAYLRRILKGRR